MLQSACLLAVSVYKHAVYSTVIVTVVKLLLQQCLSDGFLTDLYTSFLLGPAQGVAGMTGEKGNRGLSGAAVSPTPVFRFAM